MEVGPADIIRAALQSPLMPLWLVGMLSIVLLLALAFAGHQFGRAEFERDNYKDDPPAQLPGSTSLSALLALLGLLLAFTFSSALSWSEARQSSLVEETAAIGTAFLRADLLAEPGRTELKQRLLDYAQTREPPGDWDASGESIGAFVDRSVKALDALWPATLKAIARDTPAQVQIYVTSGITEVLDAHTRRIAAVSRRIPMVAKILIFSVAGVAVFVIGNRSALQGRKLNWRTFLFSIVLVCVMFVILDVDRPREGLVTINSDVMKSAIVEMRAALGG